MFNILKKPAITIESLVADIQQKVTALRNIATDMEHKRDEVNIQKISVDLNANAEIERLRVEAERVKEEAEKQLQDLDEQSLVFESERLRAAKLAQNFANLLNTDNLGE